MQHMNKDHNLTNPCVEAELDIELSPLGEAPRGCISISAPGGYAVPPGAGADSVISTT